MNKWERKKDVFRHKTREHFSQTRNNISERTAKECALTRRKLNPERMSRIEEATVNKENGKQVTKFS